MSVTETSSEPTPDASSKTVLRTEGITKRFGALTALRGIDMHLGRGEVLGLVGDNGAGKSTFVKIICGFHRPDNGKIFIEDREVQFRTVQEARKAGIETVYQDLALIPQLPIYQNLFLNRELIEGGRLGFLSNRRMRKLAKQYLDEIKVSIPNIDAEVERLSGGQRQAIAVARATRSNAKVLLLDEPLSAMGAKESALIIDLVKDLSANGASIIVIDHNYAHIFELCDRINVIQQGVVSFDRPVSETSLDELTDFMVSEYRKQVESGRRGRDE